MPQCSSTSGIPASWQASKRKHSICSEERALTKAPNKISLVWTKWKVQNKHTKQQVHFASRIQMKQQKCLPLTVGPRLANFLKCCICYAHTTMIKSHFSWKTFCYSISQSRSNRKYSFQICRGSMFPFCGQRQKTNQNQSTHRRLKKPAQASHHATMCTWNGLPSLLPTPLLRVNSKFKSGEPLIWVNSHVIHLNNQVKQLAEVIITKDSHSDFPKL